jgi:hypothetical protein
MHEISYNAGSNSGSDSQGESGSSGIDTERFANIKTANRKIRLLDVLRHYGINVEKNHQRPIWSNNIKCPFPSHKGAKERTPSFAYNFVSDRFCCLGCQKSGRAVEFISLYEEVSRSSVADNILSKYGGDSIQDDIDEYNDDLLPILVKGSNDIRNLIIKYKDNPKKLKDIDKIIWWLDFYIMTKNIGKNINAEELSYRLDKIKELFKDEY